MRGLHDLAEAVAHRAGIRVRHGRFEALAAAVRRADPAIDAEGLPDALDGPQGDELLERIVDEVAVKETFFFREPDELRTLDWQAMLAAAGRAGRSAARVWSAACATGEEAYTVAMLAAEAFGTTRPPVSVLGTDISPTALAAARAGEYGKRALRRTDHALVDRHFERRGGSFAVADDIRDLVEFRRHNLVRDPAPAGPPFDLVLCRNVLIYFDPPTAHEVVSSLRSALSPDGRIVFGAADWLCVPQEDRPTVTPVAGSAPRPVPKRAAGRAGLRRSAGAPATRPAARPARRPAKPSEASLAEAVAAADSGRLEDALATTEAVLARDPASAAAHFVRGLALLAAGDPTAAIQSLRAALYREPDFAFAAFKLGRAFDALGDARAARRAYQQALRSLDPDDARHADLLADVDASDVAAACTARLAALAAVGR